MIRNVATIAISAVFALSLCACGGGGGAQPTDQTAAAPEEAAPASEPEELGYSVDSPIDLKLEDGELMFVRVEKANENLTDFDNALVFVYEFTNLRDEPTDSQRVFWANYYQNGTEITNNAVYYSNGGDQYDLIGAFYNTALKGGTVTYGQIVIPKDDSPITVYAHPNGSPADESNSQYMVVSFGDAAAANNAGDNASASESPDTAPAAPSYTADDIDAALQGSWTPAANTGATVTFDNGSAMMQGPGVMLLGTYEIDMENSIVSFAFEATDGTATATQPFMYENGVLRLFDKEGNEFTKNESAESVPSELKVGETFTNNAATIEFESFEVVDEIYPSDTSGYYTYCADEENHSYLLVTCRFTNNGTDYGVPGRATVAAFAIGDNKYNAAIEADDYDRFDDSYSIEAKDSGLIYVYASVPDSVIGTGETRLFWHVPQDPIDLQYLYGTSGGQYDMVVLEMPQ